MGRPPAPASRRPPGRARERAAWRWRASTAWMKVAGSRHRMTGALGRARPLLALPKERVRCGRHVAWPAELEGFLAGTTVVAAEGLSRPVAWPREETWQWRACWAWLWQWQEPPVS